MDIYSRERLRRPRPFFRSSFLTPYSAAADTEPSANALAPRFINDLANTLLINGFNSPAIAFPHPLPRCLRRRDLIVVDVVV